MQLTRLPLETVLEANELPVDTLLLRPTNAETVCCELLLEELAVAKVAGAATVDIMAEAIVCCTAGASGIVEGLVKYRPETYQQRSESVSA